MAERSWRAPDPLAPSSASHTADGGTFIAHDETTSRWPEEAASSNGTWRGAGCANVYAMNDSLPNPTRRSANAVLRSIVSPALGVAVGALVLAGATSACSSGTAAADDGAIERVGQQPGERVEVVGTKASPTASEQRAQPSASASAAPSASVVASASAAPSATTPMPKPGEMPKPGDIPNPGKVAPPKVGQVPARPESPKVGYFFAPGFASSAFSPANHEERPTRRTRHATDADATRLRGSRRALA